MLGGLLIIKIIKTLVELAQLFLVIRAILSWVPLQENKFTDFIYNVTEPMLLPARKLIEKTGVSLQIPIDVSFLLTFIVLVIIERLL